MILLQIVPLLLTELFLNLLYNLLQGDFAAVTSTFTLTLFTNPSSACCAIERFLSALLLLSLPLLVFLNLLVALEELDEVIEAAELKDIAKDDLQVAIIRRLCILVTIPRVEVLYQLSLVKLHHLSSVNVNTFAALSVDDLLNF